MVEKWAPRAFSWQWVFECLAVFEKKHNHILRLRYILLKKFFMYGEPLNFCLNKNGSLLSEECFCA